MLDILRGLKANFDATSDYDNVIKGDIGSPGRVQELVSLMEKHYTAEKSLNGLKSQAGDVAVSIFGVQEDDYIMPGKSAAVMPRAMESLIFEGSEGQQAILDFCERHGEYNTAFNILELRVGAQIQPFNRDVTEDPGFAAFVDKVIQGNDIENPVSRGINGEAGVNDRLFRNSKLKSRVSELSAVSTDPSLPAHDV